MHKLKLRAADYVHMEEMQTLHTKFCNDYAATTANPTPQPPRPYTRLRKPRQPRFTRYAPLTVARSRILDEALQVDLIPPPCKTTTPPNADMTKYCRYHRNYGHTTEDYKALQDKIEELVYAGHFCRFIRRDDHSSRSHHPLAPTTDAQPNPLTRHPNQPAPTSPPPTLPYVAPSTPSLVASLVEDPPLLPERNTSTISNPSIISLIPTINVVCLPSSSQMMTFMALTINHITHSHHRRCMPPIIFTDDDFHGLDHQQDDPMVIIVEIENYAVKKVLVDQGSSVDILYWATYQKLQLLDTAMVPYDEPIYGSSDEQVSTRGYIDLHTVFRERTQTKTIPIRFLIVDAPTSYNVLLGCPSLNTLDAVVSTPHLAMKFPSPSGDILTIHYDQPAPTTPNSTNQPY